MTYWSLLPSSISWQQVTKYVGMPPRKKRKYLCCGLHLQESLRQKVGAQKNSCVHQNVIRINQDKFTSSICPLLIETLIWEFRPGWQSRYPQGDVLMEIALKTPRRCQRIIKTRQWSQSSQLGVSMETSKNTFSNAQWLFWNNDSLYKFRMLWMAHQWLLLLGSLSLGCEKPCSCGCCIQSNSVAGSKSSPQTREHNGKLTARKPLINFVKGLNQSVTEPKTCPGLALTSPELSGGIQCPQ